MGPGIVSGCTLVFLGFFCCMFYCIIDPPIDRRIIYNDFRSNPYLYFDAGLVPRALGVQLGEFYCLFIRLPFHWHASIVYSVLYLLLIDYRTDIVTILDCDHSLGYHDRHLC